MTDTTCEKYYQEHKQAATAHPIHPLLAGRWSPYTFSDRPVDAEDVASLFEAARWAASAYNEQPWRYIVASREDREAFERLLSTLNEPNRKWAGKAALLALGIVRKNFTQSGAPNNHARHDLGQASATLTVEANSRGLLVHQMSGILPDRAREIYDIPDDYEVVTAIAMGYPSEEYAEGDPLARRDLAERTRRPLGESVFGGSWGEPSKLILN